MADRDFTIEQLERDFGLTFATGDLFPGLTAVAPPLWLTDTLSRSRRHPWTSEKARGEYVVSPILTAVCELATGDVTLFSGVRVDADSARGLNGECDFVLAQGPAIPILRAPLVTVVEAKQGDVEGGLTQCVAQMIGAQVFNARVGRTVTVWGCVTNAAEWQFLRLAGAALTYHQQRLVLADPGGILAAFLTAVVAPTG